MISRLSDEFISNRAWLREVVGGKNLILRGTSALEYLEMFDGYLGEKDISVYSQSISEYENVDCHIVHTFDNIDFFKHGNVLCATFNQTINDMLNDSMSDEQALSEALSNYFYSNNESFDGLQIKPENIERFERIKNYAVAYYFERSD